MQFPLVPLGLARQRYQRHFRCVLLPVALLRSRVVLIQVSSSQMVKNRQVSLLCSSHSPYKQVCFCPLTHPG